MLMAWGPFVFESNAAAYEELRRRTGKRRPEHPIIGRRPAGQYLGPENARISMRGTVFPLDQPGTRNTARALSDEAELNTSYVLVSGEGDVFGVFTLDKAEVIESEIGPDGMPFKVAYDLEFCTDDDPQGQIWSVWP